jgi:hypothetical protein
MLPDTRRLQLVCNGGHRIIVFCRRLAVRTKLLHPPALSSLTLLLEQTLSLPFLLVGDHVTHSGSGTEEVRVVGVDVGTLNRDKRLHILRCRAQSLPQQVRDHLDQLSL